MKDWTYGAEHELGDWPLDRPLPKGSSHNRKDYSCVNSNGVGNDPHGETYRFGGEINTPPTDTISGQCEVLADILRCMPEAVVNYRSNLHVHIRVPGLRDDLPMLKRIANFNCEWLPRVLDLVEPIPKPKKEDFYQNGPAPNEEYLGAHRRWKRRRVSHHTLIPEARVRRMLMAGTTKEFFEAEVPATKAAGKPMWHAQPRAAVNLRQLLETDTVEFRHFPGTLERKRLYGALAWCMRYLGLAMGLKDIGPARDPVDLYKGYFGQDLLPQFPEYVHWQEERYRATCCDGSVSRTDIAANIAKIEHGEFDEHEPTRLPL